MKCVFVGYITTQKGYKAYHPSTKRFFVSMDVTFHEHEMFFPWKHFILHLKGRGDLEVQNHDRLDKDIKLFNVMPTNDGIQDNGDENMKDQIQNNVNENMVEDDSIISLPTSNSLLIQSKNNFVKVSPKTLTSFHSVVDTLLIRLASVPNVQVITSRKFECRIPQGFCVVLILNTFQFIRGRNNKRKG